MQKITAAGREYRFNPHGLSEEEQQCVRDVAEETIRETAKISGGFVERCHFFSSVGYRFLSAAVARTGMRSPRILGDDANCFDQHYWLAFDVPSGPGDVDAAGSYIGLAVHASPVLNT